MVRTVLGRPKAWMFPGGRGWYPGVGGPLSDSSTQSTSSRPLFPLLPEKTGLPDRAGGWGKG